jgi:16S rRNA (guanine1207-N2)-methyltransferase
MGLYSFIKGGKFMSHYFTDDVNLKHDIEEKTVNINGRKFTFFTDNGVFSKKGLDFGTRTLLENLPDDIHGDVLDFGCGYGPICIYVKKTYDCNVDAIDINNRSIEMAKKNAVANNVDVNIFNSNIYENVTKKYDYMFVNKEDFMKCLENGIFELDDEVEIQKWYIYETDDNGNILELLEEIE